MPSAAAHGDVTNCTQVHTRRVTLVRRTYGDQVEAERHSHFMLERLMAWLNAPFCAFSGLDRWICPR
jgi:hypothetical protein